MGAYLGVYLFGLTGNFWFCLLGVPVGIGCLGLVVERILIRPLYGRGIDYPLLLTFGLGYVLVDLIRIAFGIEGRTFSTPEALRGSVSIGVGDFPLYRLFVIGITALILLGLCRRRERAQGRGCPDRRARPRHAGLPGPDGEVLLHPDLHPPRALVPLPDPRVAVWGHPGGDPRE